MKIINIYSVLVIIIHRLWSPLRTKACESTDDPISKVRREREIKDYLASSVAMWGQHVESSVIVGFLD